MIRFEQATVVQLRDSWPGVQRIWARSEIDGTRLSALAYAAMTPELTVGMRVLLNTNALRRGLGTGGDAFVVAAVSPEPTVPGPEATDPAGHMMKARYTPMQLMLDAVDDPASEYHSVIDSTASLSGLPVVVADLHSALPAVVAGVHATVPHARIVYIHTDWAALPVAYSRTNAVLRAEGLVAATISAGQSFGGDREAVSIPSALVAAHAVESADVAIVIQGPGNLGTGTRWGYSGIAVADALNQVAALDGIPIHALRVSNADKRTRHAGLSHHSATVLERMCLASVRVPCVKREAADGFDASIVQALDNSAHRRSMNNLSAHRYEAVDPSGLLEAIDALPITVSTMGRGRAEDPKSFLYAALAGRLAAQHANRADRSRQSRNVE